jgi:hypothetical protein
MLVRNGGVAQANVTVRGSSYIGEIIFEWKRLILVWPGQNMEIRHGCLFLKAMVCDSQRQNS